MEKVCIDIDKLRDRERYLVDFGREVEFLTKEEIHGYRVFGNLDIWKDDSYIGTLPKLSYKEAYCH